jgi:hypothetical protein
MKKIVFLLITLICCNILLAQHVTVANTKMNILYVNNLSSINKTTEFGY